MIISPVACACGLAGRRAAGLAAAARQGAARAGRVRTQASTELGRFVQGGSDNAATDLEGEEEARSLKAGREAAPAPSRGSREGFTRHFHLS
jgi:hypothetical protein